MDDEVTARKQELRRLLGEAETIAVVGLSSKPDRPSHEVAEYLQEHGYRVIPVNPCVAGKEIHGERCYARVTEIPERVDMVDVFRRSEWVDPIVDDTIASGADILWMQLGVINEAAARRAQAAGLTVVMDRCTSRDYRRFFLSSPS